MKYTLETHNFENGIHVSELTEHVTRKSADKDIMLYKLSHNIGYTLYNITKKEFLARKNNWSQYDDAVVAQWFDKAAFRGAYNDSTTT